MFLVHPEGNVVSLDGHNILALYGMEASLYFFKTQYDGAEVDCHPFGVPETYPVAYPTIAPENILASLANSYIIYINTKCGYISRILFNIILRSVTLLFISPIIRSIRNSLPS